MWRFFTVIIKGYLMKNRIGFGHVSIFLTLLLGTNLSLASDNFAQAIKILIPAKVSIDFKRTLNITINDKEIKNLNCENLSDYDDLFKVAINAKEINLSFSKTLNDLFTGSRSRNDLDKKNCLNEDDKTFALRLGMKAVAIAWDQLGLRSRDDLEKLKRCLAIKRQGKMFLSDECEYFLSDKIGQTSFSNRVSFRNQLGWFGSSLNASMKNISPKRYPESDIFFNKEHAFATHFSFYVTDSNYACRYPSMNEFFNDITLSNKNSSCTLHSKIRKHEGKREFSDISPDKVKRIDYFLASPGEDMSSGHGHAMLRLVLCPEDFEPSDYNLETQKDIENFCAGDIRDDLIVSFRASVDDIKLSYLKGFFGGYPSVMFMMDPSKVIQEYVQKEMRNLYSIPLKLSNKERSRLTLKILEDYWTYQGDYQFLTSNCATETRDLLRSVVQTPWYSMQDSIKPLSIAIDLEGADRLYFKFSECDWTDVNCLKKFTNLKDVPSLMMFNSNSKKLVELAQSQNPKTDDIKKFFDTWSFAKRQEAFELQKTKFENVKLGAASEELSDLTPYLKKIVTLRKASYELSKLLENSFSFDMARQEKMVKEKIEKAKDAKKFEEKTKEYLILMNKANSLPTNGGYGVAFNDEIISVDYAQISTSSQEMFMKSTEELMGGDFIKKNLENAKEINRMSKELSEINEEVLKMSISVKKRMVAAIKNEIEINPSIKTKLELIKFLNQKIGVEYFSSNNLSNGDIKALLGFDPESKDKE
jgi:hypothetical protein